MKMIFETPATVWQEAFPLGNGRIGALMFGDGEAETLYPLVGLSGGSAHRYGI